MLNDKGLWREYRDGELRRVWRPSWWERLLLWLKWNLWSVD